MTTTSFFQGGFTQERISRSLKTIFPELLEKYFGASCEAPLYKRPLGSGLRMARQSDDCGKVSYGLRKMSDGLGKVSDVLGKKSDGLGKESDGLGKV